MDLVFPKGNERTLANMAFELGEEELHLCYPAADPYLKERKTEAQQLGCGFAVLVKSQQEIQRVRHVTQNIVAVGKPWAFDDKRVKFVIDFEYSSREDFIHHRNAGLTQVFAKKAVQRNITLLVNVNGLLSGDRDILLGRILQNNTLFRKYKPDVVVVSGCATPLEMRAPKDRELVLRL